MTTEIENAGAEVAAEAEKGMAVTGIGIIVVTAEAEAEAEAEAVGVTDGVRLAWSMRHVQIPEDDDDEAETDRPGAETMGRDEMAGDVCGRHNTHTQSLPFFPSSID